MNFNYKKVGITLGVIIIVGLMVYFNWYLPLKEGYVSAYGWDCPADHPVKANEKSMIYHLPNDQYYSRTDALNGKCFDTAEHARAQGFRGILR